MDRQGGWHLRSYLCHNRVILTPGIFSPNLKTFWLSNHFDMQRFHHLSSTEISSLWTTNTNKNKNTQIPLINGDLLLVFVADNEPDDSSKTSDQVEQGQDQPHHVNLGQDVNSKMFSKMFFYIQDIWNIIWRHSPVSPVCSILGALQRTWRGLRGNLVIHRNY